MSFGSTQEVGAGTGDPAGLSHAVMGLGKPKLFWGWIWRRMGRGPGDKEQEEAKEVNEFFGSVLKSEVLRENPEQGRLSLDGGGSI